MDGAIAVAPYRIHRYPSALIDRIVLGDGRTVTVRPVLPQDAQAEQVFVASLSPSTRRRRFHLAVNALPESLLRKFTEIDYRTHVALVAEATGDIDDEPVLVADARYVVRDDASAADFAVVVADQWQGVGLGQELMRRLARHARRHGITHLLGDVQTGNEPMLALARKLGGQVAPALGEASLLRARFVL
jgi:acetyltransferase